MKNKKTFNEVANIYADIYTVKNKLEKKEISFGKIPMSIEELAFLRAGLESALKGLEKVILLVSK